MKRMPGRHAAIALSIALALAACKPADEPAAEGGADTPAAAEGDATGLEIAGLPNEKAQASYMVGMDIGESLEQIKGEVDIAIVIEAIEATLAGGDPKLTEEQRAQVRQRFAAALQERRAAEMQAKAAANATEGQAFLAANKDKPDVQTTASGLQYQVLEAGKGEKPTADDVVRVHYKGTLLDGTEFDSSYERGEPAMFALAQVVPGWQEGIALMPVGSKYRLWIPSELAYGEQSPSPLIPANSVLVFDLELLGIKGDENAAAPAAEAEPEAAEEAAKQ